MEVATNLAALHRQFPTDESVIEHIARTRFGENVRCPRCRSGTYLLLVTKRRALRCSRCSLEIRVTSQTLFDNTQIPLRRWFYLMLTMSNSPRALPIRFVSTHLGLSPMTAFAMLSKIRLHLQAMLAGRILGGGDQILQIDETWVTQVKNPGRPSGAGAIVFGIYSKSGVITKVIPNRSSVVLMREVLSLTHPDSVFVTDQWRSYNFLGRLGFKHVRLNHSKGEWVNKDGYSSVGIEGYWGNLKYFLQSASLAPSIDYFGGYLAEHAFRYNCRKVGKCPFQEMISRFPIVDKQRLPMSLIYAKPKDPLEWVKYAAEITLPQTLEFDEEPARRQMF